MNRSVMQNRLQNWNHVAVTAVNGQEAVDVVEEDFDFDCVLMDLM